MKVKKCPARKHCFDYKDNNCDNCDFGNEFTKLHKRIDRLKKQNETLTIQRNAWELTAKALGEKWISVDERLPESGVICLLCCDVKRYDGTHRQYVCDGFHAERFKEECYSADDECVTEYNEETDEYYLHEGWYEEINNWDEYSSIAIDDTVTHWMPLPEPPKMKGGAE